MNKPLLVYDVGLFDGTDTEYYLYCGFIVVAIDANPVMIENARARFAQELNNKRLFLVNAGIADGAGEITFWISDEGPWSSFDRKIAARSGTKHHAVTIPIVPFVEILKTYGVPHYLKIDIEGNDHVCVSALKKSERLPPYISVESECFGEDDKPSDADVLAMLHLLHDVGYRRFKLLNQRTRTAARMRFIANTQARLTSSLANGRLSSLGLSGLVRPLTDAARIERDTGYHFTVGSSGPLASDIPGPWMSVDQASAVYVRERRRYFATGSSPQYTFWYDWHATI
jgi:FkbM family methyltransferase